MSQQIWTYQLPYGLTIKGFSRGSQNTGFVIPELKLMFDAQMRSDSCSHIFITHGNDAVEIKVYIFTYFSIFSILFLYF